MIGIIGALKEEVQNIKADMNIRFTETVSGCEYTVGSLNGKDIVITGCGMGKVNAACCTAVMIERYAPEIIINTGVGGSLCEDLKVLHITVAEDVVQHDYDLVPLGYKKAQVDNFDSPYFVCDKEVNRRIIEAAEGFGYKSHLVRFATGDCFVDSAEDKNRLSKEFSAKLCDMETGAIAQVCKLSGVRFSSIRTVSDSGDGGAMEFNEFLDSAAKHSSEVLKKVIENL